MTSETKSSSTPTSLNYSGFVAGIFSGVSKLAVGHPFDTIKVRLQTAPPAKFNGPLDCCMQTVRREGIRAFYKGATPPLVGWMFMDSVMLGSLTLYRDILRKHVFTPTGIEQTKAGKAPLPLVGHLIAGSLSGFTVSFVAAPFEHIKARLQIQYAASKSNRQYTGPVDCARKIYSSHGIRGIYHGLSATLVFRSFAGVWWGSYHILAGLLEKHTFLSNSPAMINFWAGGLSAQCFWIAAYPADVVKQRIMTDSLGPDRKYPRWSTAVKSLWAQQGMPGFWRGFVPSFLRAFPANAAALTVFESVMGVLN